MVLSIFVNGPSSKLRTLSACVPQGSVLGPLLFVVYLNDIADQLDCLTRLFADDTSLYLSIEDKVRCRNTLNRDIQTIYDWSLKWKVLF